MLDLALLALTVLAQRGGATPPPKAPRPAAPQRPEAGRGRGDTAPPAAAPPARGQGPAVEGGPPVLLPGEVPQEEGALGELPPQALHVELAIASVDRDTQGRSRTDLAGLVPLGDGFAALIRDERDGARAHVVLRLGPDLALRGVPERLDPRPSGHGQTDATLAVSPRGGIGAVWFDSIDREGAMRGRWWDCGESAEKEVWSLPMPLARREVRGAAGEASVPRTPEPALAWTPEGCAVAWNAGGRVLLRQLHPGGTHERADVLGARLRSASSGPRLASDDTGALACAFDSGGAVLMFLRLSAGENAHCSAGPGRLSALAADPSTEEEGWWVLVKRQGQLVLRHLARSGGPDRAELELADRPWKSADLAATREGACVLVHYAGGGLVAAWVDGPTAGLLGTTELRPARGQDVITARVAASGERHAFLWTELSRGSLELLGRTSTRGGADLTPARALLEGDGSAVQEHPSAAWAGDRGAIAWSDHRFGEPVVAVRGLGAGGKPGEAELFLPSDATATEPGAERAIAKRPAIAVQPSGRGLAAWIGVGRSGPAVFVQAFEVDAAGEVTAGAPAQEIEPDPVQVPTHFEPAVLALAGERGFAVAWVRSAARKDAEGEVSGDDGRTEARIVRLGSTGTREGLPRTAGVGSRLARPALTQLDDGRIVLAWDAQPQIGARRLAARVLSERLEPEIRELCFETMWHGTDFAPALAPAAEGFAMAWTSGEDTERDVFARTFDTAGRPLSRPIALTPRLGSQEAPTLARCDDGSFVAVWQDDASKATHLVGRRFRPGSGRVGPVARFRFGAGDTLPQAASPIVFGLEGGGLLLIGSHGVVDKGREIGLCRLGTGWDEVEGR